MSRAREQQIQPLQVRPVIDTFWFRLWLVDRTPWWLLGAFAVGVLIGWLGGR